MKFGRVPVAEAAGLVSAHTLRAGALVLKKGSTVAPEHLDPLAEAGFEEVVAAALEPGDVGEDAAAGRLAAAIAGAGLRVEPPFTGRANLFAEHAGVLVVARAAIDGINAVDEALTVATLPAYKPLVAGEMVATVKIIPYAVAGERLEAALAAAGSASALGVAPYRRRRVAAISTLLPGLKPSVVAKTIRVLGDRLAPTGAEIVAESSVPHEAAALRGALVETVAAERADLVVVFGASAIADRRDVIPAAIEAAGGTVTHFGMPVDPGNLLLMGTLPGEGGPVPVIGAPGCARSPAENGFDWILHRLLADLPVTRADIVALGVGGLLMEIVSRPQPRSGEPSAPEHHDAQPGPDPGDQSQDDGA